MIPLPNELLINITSYLSPTEFKRFWWKICRSYREITETSNLIAITYRNILGKVYSRYILDVLLKPLKEWKPIDKYKNVINWGLHFVETPDRYYNPSIYKLTMSGFKLKVIKFLSWNSAEEFLNRGINKIQFNYTNNKPLNYSYEQLGRLRKLLLPFRLCNFNRLIIRSHDKNIRYEKELEGYVVPKFNK